MAEHRVTVSKTSPEIVGREAGLGAPAPDETAWLRAAYRDMFRHSRTDPGLYRKQGEMEEWRQRDPLVRLRALLIDTFVATEHSLVAVEADVDREIGESFEARLAGPFPEASEVYSA